jgi:ABC-type lipoprotein release transport system permease subunit
LWVAARNTALSAARGIAIGVLLVLLLQGLLAKWMNSTHTGVGSFFAVTLLLMLCACFACLLPALRAASIRPTEALRYE